MTPTIDATIDGRTLKDFFGVTRDELKAKLDSKTLLAAARGDSKKLSSWIAETKWQQLPGGVADHVCDFLQANLVGVFAGAWSKYAELKKCAKETLNDGNTMDVGLADHDFTYEMEPHVEVLLNGVRVAEIPFKIQWICTVTGLDLYLKNGCIHQICAGKCEGTANILCAEKNVWSRKFVGVNLPGELHFSKPIRLAETKPEK